MRLYPSILAVFLTACVPSKQSELKHDWSKLRRDGTNSMIQQCKYGEVPAPMDKISELNIATKYLQDLGSLITTNVTNSLLAEGKMSPFTDKLAYNNLCLEVVELGESNAYSVPRTGNIYFGIQMLKNAANDAQVAAILTHEMVHILMAHESDNVSPNLRLSEIVSEERFAEIGSLCDSADYRDLDDMFFQDVLGYSQEVREAQSRLTSVLISFKKKPEPFQTLFECAFAAARQADVAKLSELSEQPLKTRDAAFIESWNQRKNAFVALANDVSIQTAIQEAQYITDRIKGEFKGDEDAMYNWREDEADEVGLELLHRAGFKVKEAVRFWMAELQRSEGTLVECGEAMSSDSVPPRGDRSHPNTCHRIKNMGVDEMRAHMSEYRDNPSNVVTVFEGVLDDIKSR